MKSRLKHWARRTGLLHPIRLATNRTYRLRSRLASAHLQGLGLEIGALHFPLHLPRCAKAGYVDVATREESIEKFPELDPRDIVPVEYLVNGFTLDGVPAGKFDFLVANHVLEHTSNPLGALANWFRVLKKGGILYCAVPVADRCFDKGRPVTSYEHLLKDYRAYASGDMSTVKLDNRAHYREWLEISQPVQGIPPPPPAELEARIDELSNQESEIHFHTFDPDSFRKLWIGLGESLFPGLKILALEDVDQEVIAVVRAG